MKNSSPASSGRFPGIVPRSLGKEANKHEVARFRGRSSDREARAVARPSLPQTRTCAINAFGSSSYPLAAPQYVERNRRPHAGRALCEKWNRVTPVRHTMLLVNPVVAIYIAAVGVGNQCDLSAGNPSEVEMKRQRLMLIGIVAALALAASPLPRSRKSPRRLQRPKGSIRRRRPGRRGPRPATTRLSIAGPPPHWRKWRAS